jgi:hypothetical protein
MISKSIEEKEKQSGEEKNKIPFEVISGFDNPIDWNPNTDAAIMVRGEMFFIDRSDLEFVCSRRFYINPSGYMDYSEKGKKVEFHRKIMNCPAGMIVDHINRQRNDDRRRFLRIKNQSHNQANKLGTHPIGFRGLKYTKGKWEASVGFNNGRIYIGRFDKREDAARAYDLRAIECFGECAVTNFPIQEYEVPKKCLADDLAPTVIHRSVNEPCQWNGCDKRKKRDSDYCFRHTKIMRIREEKKFKGERLRVITTSVSQICVHLDHKNEKVKSFARSLCSYHYRKQMEKEGYVKPKKKYQCSVFLENGEQCGGAVIKVRERLCSTHYKKKYGLFKKLGRPKRI